MNITVNRSTWHRGKESAEKDAFIYNSVTNKADIIGVLLLAAGVHRGLIDKTRLPSVAAHQHLPQKRTFGNPLEWLVTKSHADTPETIELIKLNDDPSLKEDEREEKIKTFLYFRGISATFVDKEEIKTAPKPKTAVGITAVDIYEELATERQRQRMRAIDNDEL